jgi:hypothetical protein
MAPSVRGAGEELQRFMLGTDEAIARLGVLNEPGGLLPPDLNQASASQVAQPAPMTVAAQAAGASCISALDDSGSETPGTVDPSGGASVAGSAWETGFMALRSEDASPNDSRSAMNQQTEKPARPDVGSDPGSIGLRSALEECWEAAFLTALMLELRGQPARRQPGGEAVTLGGGLHSV